MNCRQYGGPACDRSAEVDAIAADSPIIAAAVVRYSGHRWTNGPSPWHAASQEGRTASAASKEVVQHFELLLIIVFLTLPRAALIFENCRRREGREGYERGGPLGNPSPAADTSDSPLENPLRGRGE